MSQAFVARDTQHVLPELGTIALWAIGTSCEQSVRVACTMYDNALIIEVETPSRARLSVAAELVEGMVSFTLLVDYFLY